MYLQCWKSTRRWDKIFILWILFTIQLLLIGLFVLFGNTNNISNDIDDDSPTYRSNEFNANAVKIVKFVKNVDISLNIRSSTTASSLLDSPVLPPLGNFLNEFFECAKTNLNYNHTHTQYCFRNGSVERIPLIGTANNNPDDCSCVCQAHYHGKDCGQPEVVWRAFITSHISRTNNDLVEIRPQSLLNSTQKHRDPHRIFYLIHSTALSLTTVEIQFMELNDLVDLFILCDEIGNHTESNEIGSKYQQFAYHQESNEHRSGFFLKQLKSKIVLFKTRQKCTPKWMYKMFRNKLNKNSNDLLNGNDILLFSSYDEILNRNAITYLKWYNDWTHIQPIRFRLKYTVYGFYWQHPDHTILSSGACQLHVLDELYRGDPMQMVQSKNTGMIIGGLNHFGGWFCQYCYESSINIVQKLKIDRSMNVFSNNLDKNEGYKVKQQSSVIDSTYIESLISAGLFVDAKLNLIRLHRFSDQYYAPDYVTAKSWKYESMLTNTYAHYDGEDDE